MGINNSSGITNYIVGVETLEQVIKQVPNNNNLHIIPSGPIPPNPVELIESEKMRDLFRILREKYDYIIVDTSPVGMVSDAKSLAPLMDCSMFVTRFNYTPRDKFKELVGELDTKIFKKPSIIFNGINLETSYGYSSYGYSNYGYGYGNTVQQASPFVSFLKGLKHRII